MDNPYGVSRPVAAPGREFAPPIYFLPPHFAPPQKNLLVTESDLRLHKRLAVMHESIPGVTIPPRDTPGNLPDRQFTGVGNLPFIYVHGGRVLEDPGDLTNGCPESHPPILRQQNLVSGTHVGALIVFCALVIKVA